MKTKNIKVHELTTSHRIVIAGFDYAVTDIEELETGSRYVTIDTGYAELLKRDSDIKVVVTAAEAEAKAKAGETMETGTFLRILRTDIALLIEDMGYMSTVRYEKDAGEWALVELYQITDESPFMLKVHRTSQMWRAINQGKRVHSLHSLT